jgi:hypothetical protein
MNLRGLRLHRAENLIRQFSDQPHIDKSSR